MNDDLTVIIPLRGRRGGKTRLAERFTEAQRVALVTHMAAIVVDAVVESGVAAQILLVTRDPEFASEVVDSRTGVRIVPQSDQYSGLNGAIDLGRDATTSASFMVLFADLPLIEPDDVSAIASTSSRVVLGRDRHGTGTNALLVRDDPDRMFAFAFGVDSYPKHVLEARRLGMTYETILRPGSEIDLDTINDWYELPNRLRDELIRSEEAPGGGLAEKSVWAGAIASNERS